MYAVKLKVNGTTVATLLDKEIHMGSGRSNGYTPKYSSSSPYTTSSYTLGPLSEGDKVTVALDSSINTGDTFRYTSSEISVSTSIYAPANYILTYTANGGTGTNVTQSVKAGNSTTLKAANTFTPATTATHGISLNKDGGTGGDATFVNNQFYKWLIGSSYYNAGASYKPGGDTTVKATWSTNYKLGTPTKSNSTVNGYTITFNANGGSCNTSSLTAKNTISYSFSGWKDSNNVYNSETTIGGAAAYSLTAQWTSSTTNGSIKMPSATNSTTTNRTVTLNYNKATGNNTTSSLKYNKTVSKEFKGWNTNSSATSGYAAGSSFTPTASNTMYAIWSSASTSYTSINLPIPTKENYVFSGWATSTNGTIVSSGGAYTPTSDITNLYAIWTLATVTVTIKNNNNWTGNYAPSPSGSKTYNIGTEITITQPIKDGYHFVKWVDNYNNIISDKASFKYTVTGPATLTSYADPNKFYVYYDANGGTGGTMGISTHTYGTSSTLYKNKFTKDGYIFVGWAYNRDAKPKEVDFKDGANMMNQIIEHEGWLYLYAIWRPYTMTYICTSKFSSDGKTLQWIPAVKYVYATGLTPPEEEPDDLTIYYIDENGNYYIDMDGNYYIHEEYIPEKSKFTNRFGDYFIDKAGNYYVIIK